MLMPNWYMINTFVSNLRTATVILFAICKLTYCTNNLRIRIILFWKNKYEYKFCHNDI